MGSEHQRETSDGLKINTSAHEKKLSSASSSSSSFEDIRSSPGETALPEGTKLASEETGDGILVPVPRDERHCSNESSLNTESATQSPSKQMMERPADTANSPSYRIPSSIFASKSAGQNDWSCASSESLFSIHMGNMSFTKETANWMAKSGELGLPGDFTPSGPLSPMIDLPSKRNQSHPSPKNKSGEIEQQRNEAKAAETMREIIKENEAEACKQKSPARRSHRSPSFRRSDASAASVKSFAFPILTADQKRNTSSPISQPHTPKVSQEQESPSHQKSPGTPNPEPTSKAPSNAGQSKWYSCLPCCSSRS